MRSKTRTLTAAPRKEAALHSFLNISDEKLIRHQDIAYEDGYADAREWGRDGFFISGNYSEKAKIRYLQGFNAGLRVYTVSESLKGY